MSRTNKTWGGIFTKRKKTKKANQAKKKKEEEYGFTTDGVADVSQIKAQLLQFRCSTWIEEEENKPWDTAQRLKPLTKKLYVSYLH